MPAFLSLCAIKAAKPLQISYASGESERLGVQGGGGCLAFFACATECHRCSLGEPKLFIGMLPRHYTEENLQAMFAPYGKVTETVILRNNHDGTSKGCGFVRFEDNAMCDMAIEALNLKTTLEVRVQCVCGGVLWKSSLHFFRVQTLR